MQQVKRCNEECKKQKLDHLASVVQGSFLEMPFPENSFDGCYCIEAACHSPTLLELYKQVWRRRASGLVVGAAVLTAWLVFQISLDSPVLPY